LPIYRIEFQKNLLARQIPINGTQIDLHASNSDPLENTAFVVECADGKKFYPFISKHLVMRERQSNFALSF
jgi:hypothetical protein